MKAATTIIVKVEATVATTLELGEFMIQLWLGFISWSWVVSQTEGGKSDI